MRKLLFTLIAAISVIASYAQEDESIYTAEVQRGEGAVQESVEPIATISSADNKYSISVGGNINMRAFYDFNGTIKHPDFITSMIPVPGDFSSNRRFGLDATTSRIVISGRAKNELLGDLELYLNMDFRGGAIGSYTPRVRLAYISAAGFTIGRNFTTFCDMGAAVPNIDFEGPGVCPFIYSTQIRYEKNILEDKFTLGVAAEYAQYNSSTLGETYAYQEQYIPDVPAYVQFNWNEERSNHIRLTGLYKSIPLYNVADEKNINVNGWGAQLSGSLGINRFIKILYSGTCGEGITNYMQDTYGSGLDVVVDANERANATFMYGWLTSTLIQITDRTMFSMGYSVMKIDDNDAAKFAANDYLRGEYVFGNVFYSITPRIQLAAEFLWGSRKNHDLGYNTANRINTMVQYNF